MISGLAEVEMAAALHRKSTTMHSGVTRALTELAYADFRLDVSDAVYDIVSMGDKALERARILEEKYGRTHRVRALDGSCRLGWRRWRWWVEHGERFDDVEAGAAEELVDDGLGEAGGVVFDADGAGGLVERELADAVDLADAGDGQGCGLRGLRSVAVEDV